MKLLILWISIINCFVASHPTIYGKWYVNMHTEKQSSCSSYTFPKRQCYGSMEVIWKFNLNNKSYRLPILFRAAGNDARGQPRYRLFDNKGKSTGRILNIHASGSIVVIIGRIKSKVYYRACLSRRPTPNSKDRRFIKMNCPSKTFHKVKQVNCK